MLKIVYAKTNKDSGEYLLKSLVGRDKTQKHIIFTPDRANLIYQNSIFDLIGEECLFDVDVTTISRFASRFSGDSKVLSKQGGVSIVKKILLENQDKFVSFGKSVKYKGFALNVFETLCMFKSCKITPDNIEKTHNGILDNKLHDIKIVYEEYEKFLQNDYTDSFNILTLCASKIDKSFKDTNFYFVGFDDFTKQGLYLIEKMMNNACNVCVATTYGKKGKDNNYNLYDNSILSSLIDIAKTNGCKYDLVNGEKETRPLHKALKENLFAYTQKCKYLSNDISILSYNSRKDEVENVVNHIRYLVQKQNLKYGDFTILVPSLKNYKKFLKESFDKFDVAYYLDETKCFGDNILARYVLSILKIVDDYNEIFTLLKMPFVDIDKDALNSYLDKVEKFGIQGRTLLDCEEIQCDFVASLKGYIAETQKQNTIGDFLKCALDAIENFAFLKLEEYQDLLYEKGLIEEYKKLPQCVDLLKKAFTQIDDIVNEYECTHKEFVEIFENYLENTNLTLPPLILDNVFVGEIETSFVQNTKYLYVLGCNDGIVPAYSTDLGLISDKEIGLMPKKYRLNPTIAEINKRKKFKVFENLISFDKKLYLSYVTTIDGGKAFSSSFIQDIIEVVGTSVVDGSVWMQHSDVFGESSREKNIEYLNLNQNCIDYNFARNLKNYDFLKDNKNYIEYLSLLKEFADKKVFEKYTFKNTVQNIDKGLFLSSGEIGVSEIERFNNCPYKHFVEYGLKLKDKKRSNFEAIDNGQIIHEFLKLAVPKLIKNKVCDLKKLTKSVLEYVFKNPYYQHLVANEANKANIKGLFNECERIIEGVKYQLDNSSFVPMHFEKPFRHTIGCVESNGKEVVLVGVIDRVDVWDKYFTIIDYKTGSSKMDNFDEIASGEKWQLVVYMYIVSRDKLTPAGCYYLPIKNDFTAKDKYAYQLQGITNNNREVISALDNNLDTLNHQSKLIKLETNDKGLKENSYYKNMCLADEEIDQLNDWVIEKLKNKIAEILDGNIQPYPILSGGKCACDYCKYIGLCNFNKSYGNIYNSASKCRNFTQLIEEVENE